MTDTLPVLSVVEGRPMADSRDVAHHFDKQHKHVLAAIRDLHCSPTFREPNFRPFKIKDLTGESTSHVLMTRDGFMFLAMGFTGPVAGALKEAFLARFNAMEEELRAKSEAVSHMVPRSLPEALRLAADLAEEVARKTEMISVLEPRSEALGVIADADGSFSVTDAAKLLQMPPSELWLYLYRSQWVYRRDRDGVPIAYQSKIQAGYLVHKAIPIDTGGHRPWVKSQARVTPKGLTALAQRIPLDKPGGLFGNPINAPGRA